MNSNFRYSVSASKSSESYSFLASAFALKKPMLPMEAAFCLFAKRPCAAVLGSTAAYKLSQTQPSLVNLRRPASFAFNI
jgi:hypothetical protein